MTRYCNNLHFLQFDQMSFPAAQILIHFLIHSLNREHCQQSDYDSSSYLWGHSDISRRPWVTLHLLFPRTSRSVCQHIHNKRCCNLMSHWIVCAPSSCWHWLMVLPHDTALRDAGELQYNVKVWFEDWNVRSNNASKHVSIFIICIIGTRVQAWLKKNEAKQPKHVWC